MLRADTTALFERLREANIMLQEVLSGAHENMSALENTLMLRVSEFVNSMNEVTGTTTDATTRVEIDHRQFRRHHRARRHQSRPARRPVRQPRPRSRQGGRSDRPQQRAHREHHQRAPRARSTRWSPRSTSAPRISISGSSASPACSTSRWKRPPRARAKSPAWCRKRAPRAAAPSPSSTSACASTPRTSASRTAETMRDVFAQRPATPTRSSATPANASPRCVQGMKQMAAEMQQELEATRSELRRGIFELPQETAEGAAQMRRVIVDQIEALAELNRIVARHGRSLDAVEPMRRPAREEPTLAVIGGGRGEIAAAAPPPRASRRALRRRAASRQLSLAAAPAGTRRRRSLSARTGRRRARRLARANCSTAPRATRTSARARPARARARGPRGAHAAPHHRVARIHCRSISRA